MAKKIDVTQDTLIAQLDEIRQMAVEEKQAGSAVQATLGIAKILGLIVEKQVIASNVDKYANMSKEELIAFLRGHDALEKITH